MLTVAKMGGGGSAYYLCLRTKDDYLAGTGQAQPAGRWYGRSAAQKRLDDLPNSSATTAERADEGRAEGSE